MIYKVRAYYIHGGKQVVHVKCDDVFDAVAKSWETLSRHQGRERKLYDLRVSPVLDESGIIEGDK